MSYQPQPQYIPVIKSNQSIPINVNTVYTSNNLNKQQYNNSRQNSVISNKNIVNIKNVNSINSIRNTEQSSYNNSSQKQAQTARVENSIITYDDQYIKSTKIYNTGIKEDPVPGSKFGKGNQSLNSSYWLSDLSIFIAKNLKYLKIILKNAQQAGQKYKNGEFIVLTQQANQLFIKAENQGLQTQNSLDQWLMASWLCMAAAEVDNYQYSKYSQEERQQMKQQFYNKYQEAEQIDGVTIDSQDLGIFATEFSRIDLLPQVALERLGIHNELCVMKFGEPNSQQWKTEGFNTSKRISSAKRHFDGVHNFDYSEDHIAHLIWNFMAIYHVLKTKPELNDLFNYEQK